MPVPRLVSVRKPKGAGPNGMGQRFRPYKLSIRFDPD